MTRLDKIRHEIRKWKLHLRTAQSIAELPAKEINPRLRGWFNYYGRFHPRRSGPSSGRSANRGSLGLSQIQDTVSSSHACVGLAASGS